MARRHRSTPWHAGAVARRTTWARSFGTVSLAAAGTYINDDLLANFRTDGGTTDGCTVTRIHMRLAVQSAVAATDTFFFGIFRGQNTDIGTSVAGAPNANTDPYEDWLYWSQFLANDATGGAGNGYFPGGPGAPYEIDVRAQRKIPQLQQTLVASFGQSAAGAYPLLLAYSASVLLKLP